MRQIRNKKQVNLDDIINDLYKIKIKFREHPYTSQATICYLELDEEFSEEDELKPVTTPNQITKIGDLDLHKLIWGPLAFKKDTKRKKLSQFVFYSTAIATGSGLNTGVDLMKGFKFFREGGERRIKNTLLKKLKKQKKIDIHYEVLNNYSQENLKKLEEEYGVNNVVYPLTRYTETEIQNYDNKIPEGWSPMGAADKAAVEYHIEGWGQGPQVLNDPPFVERSDQTQNAVTNQDSLRAGGLKHGSVKKKKNTTKRRKSIKRKRSTKRKRHKKKY